MSTNEASPQDIFDKFWNGFNNPPGDFDRNLCEVFWMSGFASGRDWSAVNSHAAAEALAEGVHKMYSASEFISHNDLRKLLERYEESRK